MKKIKFKKNTCSNDQVDIDNLKQRDHEEEQGCPFTISEIIVNYSGNGYLTSITSYTIDFQYDNLMQSSIMFYDYKIEDDLVTFSDKEKKIISSISDISQGDTFLSLFNQKMLEGKAHGLAKYIKDKNIDINKKKHHFKDNDMLIFLNAQKLLIDWEIIKYH